jgi:hypothetical protein
MKIKIFDLQDNHIIDLEIPYLPVEGTWITDASYNSEEKEYYVRKVTTVTKMGLFRYVKVNVR